jgi:hypothetical protein
LLTDSLPKELAEELAHARRQIAGKVLLDEAV